MEKSIAKWISMFFHPLLIPTYFVLLLFNIDLFLFEIMSLKGKLLLLSLVFSVSYIMPVLFVFFYIRMGWVKSFYMEGKQERLLPIITVGTFIYATSLLLEELSLSLLIRYFLMNMTMLSLLVLLITNYWKISLHTVGIGSLLGFLIGMSINYKINILPILYPLILVAGMVGFARLKLKAHNAMQVYAGYIIGFVAMFGIFMMV